MTCMQVQDVGLESISIFKTSDAPSRPRLGNGPPISDLGRSWLPRSSPLQLQANATDIQGSSSAVLMGTARKMCKVFSVTFLQLDSDEDVSVKHVQLQSQQTRDYPISRHASSGLGARSEGHPRKGYMESGMPRCMLNV